MTHELRFLIYARKSSESEDRQARSIEAQIAELTELARRSGMVVAGQIVEAQSAKKPGRPEFNRMIERIEAGEADGILAWHADRLARNPIDGSRIIDLLDSERLRRLQFFGSCVENTPQGKMMLSIEFGFSKYYIDALSVNVKRGHRNKIARREFPGMATLGYLNDRRIKRIVIDRKRAPFVRRAFEQYAAGEATLDSLQHYFAKHGILSRATKRSAGGKPISRNRIAKILRNPLYYGHFKWSGDIHEGNHEPIITKKLFDDVQEVYDTRFRYSQKTVTRTPKPFVRLLRCGECGFSITAEIQKGHTYYRCTKRNRTHGHCSQRYVRENALDTNISRLLTPFQPHSGWGEEMLARLEADRAQGANSSKVLASEMHARITEVSAKLDRLDELLIDGLIDHGKARERKNVLLGEKKSLEEKMSSLTRGSIAWFEPMREWILTAQRVGEIAEHGLLTEKAALARKLFGSNLVLVGQKARGEAVKPWADLAKTATGSTTAHQYNLARTFFRENYPS